jgi:arsenate reductase
MKEQDLLLPYRRIIKETKMNKKKVLFICTHNSARSQMAEGLLNALYGEFYQAYSAGSNPTEVSPYAIRVLKEIGIDISHHRSKSVNEFLGQEIDYVVTVCDRAQESCPFFPSAGVRLHQSFSDPANFTGGEEELLTKFRQTRDEIKNWLIKTFGTNLPT